MPHTLVELNALFADLRVEWNASEELVKSAEQVCGDAVIPSIKEFRYAGRRLVDAFHELANGADYKKADAFVKDAIFNCHCARHDAIDVATGIMAATLAIAVDSIGYQHILTAFPKFAELRNRLSIVRAKIRLSRANRTDRDAIYISVHEADFPTLIALYEEYQGAEDIMKHLARRQRREVLFLRATTVVALVVAIASCTFSGVQTWHTMHATPSGAASVVSPTASTSGTTPAE